MLNTKNLQIITRQGTKIGDDKAKSNTTMFPNHAYPNRRMQIQIFNDAIQVFKYLAAQEDILNHQTTKVNYLLQLLPKKDAS